MMSYAKNDEKLRNNFLIYPINPLQSAKKWPLRAIFRESAEQLLKGAVQRYVVFASLCFV
jgi:hypothetical protein